MTDTLTTGSERLMTRILVAESRDSPVAAAIKADPGIVALVEHAEWCNTHGTDDEVADRGLAALKLWETGQ